MEQSESEKTEVIYCRVSKALKKRLADDEDIKRGEAEAVIVRRALNEYFDRRDHPEKHPPLQTGAHSQLKAPRAMPQPSALRPAPSGSTAPHDRAAQALGQRAVDEITGAGQTKESSEERKLNKAVGKLERELDRKSRGKRVK